ncbi:MULTISPECIES: DUF3566 domain-containing protein [unclassified Kribbella]|uniref:DUF3566 domain-containing protein n=1 Tax=unclassified Kribbella TaxID=2644121 RepID=UPI00301590CE
MTNRARPTWPDGAADNPETQRPTQGGNKQSTAPATPASNGRTTAAPSGNGQPRSGDYRPQRPSGGAQPAGGSGGGQPRPGQSGASPSGPSSAPSSSGSAPVRPPQQPPVRPASQPSPRPATPSTPPRPEPWTPPSGAGSAAAGSAAGASSYGLTGKSTAKSTTESIGDKVTAARQAVLDKAASVKAKPETVVTKPEKASKASTRPQTRKARLRMSRIDPWSVMKTSFLLSIAFGIVTWVAVFIVWSAIGAAGVFDNINNTVTEVLGTPAAEPFRIENYINTGKVMGFTTLLACADVLIITALATLGSFLYNIAATLLGGLEVTLASED